MTRACVDHQHREDILASAAIRAWFCLQRGLPASQACRPPGMTESSCLPGPQPLLAALSPAPPDQQVVRGFFLAADEADGEGSELE